MPFPKNNITKRLQVGITGNMSQMDVEGEATPEVIENRQYSIPSILFPLFHVKCSFPEYSWLAATEWHASE